MITIISHDLLYTLFSHNALSNLSLSSHFHHEIKDEIMVRASRITHDEMLKMAGKKIADFCEGYKLYHVKKVNHDGMLIAAMIKIMLH